MNNSFYYKSDIDCIKEVKDHHDAEALEALVQRHSGIYLDTIHKMIPAQHNNVTKRELIAEKDSFIYQCALDFNPQINIKFSTFIGNKTRWRCQNLFNKAKRRKQDPIDMVKEPSSLGNLYEDVESSELQETIEDILKTYPDKRARRIFRLRYVDGHKNKVMPWRKIAEKLDLSIQGCINIHNKLIKTIKEKYEQGNTQR